MVLSYFPGHSLGAGVAVLLGLMLKPSYPDLRCFAFAAPGTLLDCQVREQSVTRSCVTGGLLCPEAAAASENFTFTIGLGDDLVMRLGVDSIENLRTDLLTAIRCCTIPKVNIKNNKCHQFTAHNITPSPPHPPKKGSVVIVNMGLFWIVNK